MREDATPVVRWLRGAASAPSRGGRWRLDRMRRASNLALSIPGRLGKLGAFCLALTFLLSPVLGCATSETAQAPVTMPDATPEVLPPGSKPTIVRATATLTLEPNPSAARESSVTVPPTAAPPSPALSPRMDYPSPPAGLDEARVVHVVDGDTIDVLLDGAEVRLRLIGLDTPETVDPRSPVQCFGREASRQAKALLAGQTVLLEADASQGEWDAYDRLLRYVWLADGRLFNLEMIAGGYAHEYTYDLPYRYQAAFRAAQEEARSQELGLWSPQTCTGDTAQAAPSEVPAPPSTPATQATSGVVISAVDKRAEVVDLTNQGAEAVPLEGWYLLSERGDQGCGLYGVLDPGETVRVYALAEDLALGGINCGHDSPIWNNSDSDPAVLFDASGAEVDRR